MGHVHSGKTKPSVQVLVRKLAMRLVRIRVAARPNDDGPDSRPATHGQSDYLSEDVSPIVIALCYERHLEMQDMLLASAEQRGDGADDAPRHASG